jgi:hypothetical protein
MNTLMVIAPESETVTTTLISQCAPIRLWYGEPDAISNALFNSEVSDPGYNCTAIKGTSKQRKPMR